MTEAANFSAGDYRFIPGVFQYSGGAAANDGYAIERVRFRGDVWDGTLRNRLERLQQQL